MKISEKQKEILEKVNTLLMIDSYSYEGLKEHLENYRFDNELINFALDKCKAD